MTSCVAYSRVEEISGTSEQLLDFQGLFTHARAHTRAHACTHEHARAHTHTHTHYTLYNTKATASYKNLHRGEKTCRWDTTPCAGHHEPELICHIFIFVVPCTVILAWRNTYCCILLGFFNLSFCYVENARIQQLNFCRSAITRHHCDRHKLHYKFLRSVDCASSRNLCTERSPKESDDTRCRINTIVLLKMNTVVLETCTGM